MLIVRNKNYLSLKKKKKKKLCETMVIMILVQSKHGIRPYHCGLNTFIEVSLLKPLNSYQASCEAIKGLLPLSHTCIVAFKMPMIPG